MELFFLYLVIIGSAVFHEYAHGWMAFELGDPTAKNAGRLTLNPLRHLDPVGTVIIPLILLFSSGIFLGWARPVPYNPYLLRDRRYGSLKVAIAGPGANFLIALILGLFVRFAAAPLVSSGLVPLITLNFLELVIYVNVILALFNLIPIPPLDGSKVAADLIPGYWRYFSGLGFIGIFVALFIAFLVLGPLAGSIFFFITGFTF